MSESINKVFAMLERVKCMLYDDLVQFNIDKAKSDIAELERLADIGRATEKAFEKSDTLGIIKYYPVGEDDFDDERYVDVNNSPTFDSVEELLEWAKGGK